MIGDSVIEKAEGFVRELFATDASGHDVHHTLRVARLASRLAEGEGADTRIAVLAALLHDADDAKLFPETAGSLANARGFLAANDVVGEDAEAVLTAIREVSFTRNRDSEPSTLEAACVRDADRLDALGAIGVARTFAYGGAHGRAMHDPSGQDGSTSIAHFHDKLLKLASMMRTSEGKRMAEARDATLRRFLDDFLAEWDAER